MLVQWNEKLATGIPVMDEDHQTIINMVNDLHVSINENNADEETVQEAIHALVGYTLSHFHREEAFLLKNNYPRYNEHKLEHDRFALQFKNFLKRFHRQEPGLRIEILAFLGEWLLHHIVETDQDFSHFMKLDDNTEASH